MTYNKTKYNAHQRGFIFTITEKQFESLVKSDCAYCGLKGGGIDRVDSQLGYIISNCVPCCRYCNSSKRDLTLIRFIEWRFKGVTKNPKIIKCITAYLLSQVDASVVKGINYG
jgi:hypothetical protein